MDQPLEVWYCDICGDQVDKDHGYVIWKEDDNHKSSDFKIIHQSRCDPRGGYRCSLALEDFLGNKGMTNLLSFLSVGAILENNGLNRSKIKSEDMGEYVDFFRRVQTPYYEEARRKFSNESVKDDFCSHNEVSPYLEGALKSIIENYN